MYLKNPKWPPGQKLFLNIIIYIVQVLFYMHIKFDYDWCMELGEKKVKYCQILISQIKQNGGSDVI